jgi:transposase
MVDLLEKASVARLGPGWPRQRQNRVGRRQGLLAPPTRQALRRRHFAFTSPERSDEIAHREAKGSAGGRLPALDTEIGAGRNDVERCFARLKQFRGLATRNLEGAAYCRALLSFRDRLEARENLQDGAP